MTMCCVLKNLECSQKFHLLNFGEVFREVPGANGAIRKMPAFEITRDGFTFLAMGFTGREAAKWKEAYIDAFNRMEWELVVSSERVLRYEAERLQQIEQQHFALQHHVYAIEPKAKMLDHLLHDDDGTVNLQEAASLLECDVDSLYDFLIDRKWIHRRGAYSTIPYVSKIDAGYLVVRNTLSKSDNKKFRVGKEPLVTAKGIAELSQLIKLYWFDCYHFVAAKKHREVRRPPAA